MDDRRARLGIDMLSVLAMPPVEHVQLASELGCGNISLGLVPAPLNPHGCPAFDLRTDRLLQRELRAALADHNVAISLAEGFSVRPGSDIADREADFDTFAGLGARRVNAVSLDPDLGRTLDQFSLLAAMAAARGMATVVEFCPGLVVGSLRQALDVVARIARPDFQILVDTMHLFRSGGTIEQVMDIDPAAIGYVQLSDGQRMGAGENYMHEAMTERLAPGEGEFPLRSFLQHVPANVVVSLEMPQLSRAAAGISSWDRLSPAVSAMRGMLGGGSVKATAPD